MPRFLRVQNQMVHIPSLSSATISTTCLGQPLLTMTYHVTKEVIHIKFRSWDDCQANFNRVKDAMNLVENQLGNIPLTEIIKEDEVKVQGVETSPTTN